MRIHWQLYRAERLRCINFEQKNRNNVRSLVIMAQGYSVLC